MTYTLKQIRSYVDKNDWGCLNILNEIKKLKKEEYDIFILPSVSSCWVCEYKYMNKKLNMLIKQLETKYRLDKIEAEIHKRPVYGYYINFCKYQGYLNVIYLIKIDCGEHICIIPKEIIKKLKN